MAYDIELDNGKAFDLASIDGWRELKNWAFEYGGPLLESFIFEGYTPDAPALQKEIAESIDRAEMMSPTVRSTLADMAISLQGAQTARFTDGLM
jgi:hypothetical protein